MSDPRADAERAATIDKADQSAGAGRYVSSLAGTRHSSRPPAAYASTVSETVADGAIRLRFVVDGAPVAIFHVYDRTDLDQTPRHFTVEPGHALDGRWGLEGEGRYDLRVLGPNGVHRLFMGHLDDPAPSSCLVWRETPAAMTVLLHDGCRPP